MERSAILQQLGVSLEMPVVTKKEATSHKKKKEDEYTVQQLKLITELKLSEKEATSICEKYGYYAGTKYYRLQQQGIEIDFTRNIRCEEPYRSILINYRKILASDGIKAANKYFYKANDELKERKCQNERN